MTSEPGLETVCLITVSFLDGIGRRSSGPQRSTAASTDCFRWIANCLKLKGGVDNHVKHKYSTKSMTGPEEPNYCCELSRQNLQFGRKHAKHSTKLNK